MIRLRLETEGAREIDRRKAHELLALETELAGHGLRFAADRPDLTLQLHGALESAARPGPVVLLYRADSSMILHGRVREQLVSGAVDAVFRNFGLRDAGLHNAPVCAGRLHLARFCAQAGGAQPELPRPALSAQHAARVHSVTWDLSAACCSVRYASLWNEGLDPVERATDVIFMGRTHYAPRQGAELAGRHRQACCDAIARLRGLRCRVEREPVLSMDAYFAALRSTRIAVSPWGLGEWTYRDFEAVYAGCVLVKPDSDHVLTFPDLYRAGELYAACRPDFADLAEVIDRVLSDPSRYDAMRRAARELLLAHASPAVHAARLAAAVHRVLET